MLRLSWSTRSIERRAGLFVIIIAIITIVFWIFHVHFTLLAFSKDGFSITLYLFPDVMLILAGCAYTLKSLGQSIFSKPVEKWLF